MIGNVIIIALLLMPSVLAVLWTPWALILYAPCIVAWWRLPHIADSAPLDGREDEEKRG